MTGHCIVFDFATRQPMNDPDREFVPTYEIVDSGSADLPVIFEAVVTRSQAKRLAAELDRMRAH